MDVVIAIGCGKFDDPRILHLQYADSDAIRFAEALTAVADTSGSKTITLHGESRDARLIPTRSNILRVVSGKSELTKKETIDKLVLFYSGHGYRSAEGRDYLLAKDSYASALDDTAIPFDMLLRHLSMWRARHLVLLLDACRIRLEHDKAVGIDQEPIAIAEMCPPGVVSICSCAPGQSSYESSNHESGVFTFAVCEALSDTGRCATIHELDTYIAKRVPQVSQSAGLPIQTPYSRVEPLGAQHLSLASEVVRRRWRSQAPLRERRSVSVARSDLGDSLGSGLCGFDFGTSYSVAALHVSSHSVQLVPSTRGPYLVPSALCIVSSTEYVAGWDALEAGQVQPAGFIQHIKRNLGTENCWEVDGMTIQPVFAASLLISSLKRNAEEYTGQPITRALISVPANFNIRQSNLLVEAFELAGLNVERLIGEPCAAALCAIDRELFATPQTSHPIVIVDLGGGTLDVAVNDAYMIEDDYQIETLGVAGDNQLGGLDFDNALATHIETELRRQQPGVRIDGSLRASISREAERAKIALGSGPATDVIISNAWTDEFGAHDFHCRLTRDEFKAISAPLIERVEKCVRAALRSANSVNRPLYHQESIQAVVMAGQGSKAFAVRDRIRSMFPDLPIVSRFQESAVATGLGLYAGVLLGRTTNLLLLDGLYRGVGIKYKALRTENDAYNVVISTTPAENTQTYTLIGQATTIPTLAQVSLSVSGGTTDNLELHFVELPAGETETEEIIGTAMCGRVKEGTIIHVELDVDASRTVAVFVGNPIEKKTFRFLINNHYELRDGTVGLHDVPFVYTARPARAFEALPFQIIETH